MVVELATSPDLIGDDAVELATSPDPIGDDVGELATSPDPYGEKPAEVRTIREGPLATLSGEVPARFSRV